MKIINHTSQCLTLPKKAKKGELPEIADLRPGENTITGSIDTDHPQYKGYLFASAISVPGEKPPSEVAQRQVEKVQASS